MKKLLLCITAIVFLILVGAVSADTPCSDSIVDDCYVDDNTTLNNSLIQGTDVGADGFIYVNGSYITLDCNGLRLNSSTSSGIGISIVGNNTTIKGCSVDLFLAAFKTNGNQVYNTTILNNSVNSSYGNAIDLRGVDATFGSKNVTIMNNSFVNVTYAILTSANTGVKYLFAYNNTAYVNISFFWGVAVTNIQRNLTFRDNFIYSTDDNGIDKAFWFDANDSAVIERNIIETGDTAIRSNDDGILNTKIINNKIFNFSIGIRIGGSTNNVIRNNSVYNSTQALRFYTSYAAATVSDNLIYNNTIGIYVPVSDSSSTINITNNNITYNDIGIHIATSTGTNETTILNISGNNISFSSDSGISISSANNGTTIYNNYFNNSPNKNANTSIWIWWNTTEYIGTNIIGGTHIAGNHWDNYNGADNDGDGIGNTELPYTSNDNITVGGDHAPLTDTLIPRLTLTISPSPSVNVGTDITVTCSAAFGELILRNNGTIVSNPYSSILDVGVYEFNCTAFVDGIFANSTAANVTVSTNIVEGCRYNTTYAYKGELIVTSNTTVIDMQDYVNDSIARSDLRDVWIPSAIDVWTNESRYLILNVSGEIGNNLTVYFGNYLNNNTVNVSWSGSLVATDTFANVTQINNFNLITHMNEVSLVEFNPPNASMTYDLYCTAGHMDFDLPNGTTDTKFLLATFSRWNESHVTVYYSSNDFYKRHIMHDSTTEYRNMWLVDAQTYQIAEVVNELDDLVGDWQRARLTVKKWIGDQIRIIDQQDFDASGFLFFYGIVGDRYIYEIYNGDESRVLGNIVVDLADLTKTITIGEITFSGDEYLKNFTFNFNYTNETGILTVDYYDPYNLTTNVNITVINTNGTQVYFADSTSNDVTFSYLVTNRTARYRVELRIDHEPSIGELLFTFFITPIPTLVLVGISEAMQTLIALGAIFMINLSVSPKNAAFGALVGSVMAFFFTAIGWLGIGYGVVSIMLLLSVFLLYSREVKKD